MKFNEYKENYPIFILTNDKDGVNVTQSKVTSISTPYFPSLTNIKAGVPLPQSKLVDLAIEINGGSKIYSLPENSSVANTPDGAILADREGIIRELTAIKSQAESALENTDLYRKNLETCKKLLSDLDPVAKKDAEVDARFNKLEQSMNSISTLLTNFIKEINHEKVHKYD